MGDLLLVTGGTRSGKSRYAVERARGWGARILYVATCQPEDEEMRERVRRHRAERPDTWTTTSRGSTWSRPSSRMAHAPMASSWTV
jgi:adenosylcobinamide kinase/adenosylcobinamide-phosphate guanylyltransferase